MIRTPIRDLARGRWRGILTALGVDPTYLRNKHGPCPLGCEGKRSWRWDDKDGNGTGICTHCGSEGGLGIVMRIKGVSAAEAARMVSELCGEAPVEAARSTADIREQRAAMARLWESGDAISASPACVAWWRSRIGGVPVSEALRSLGNMMLAKVQAPDGEGVQVHRTFLTADGHKRTDMAEPRLLMAGEYPHGSAVRLVPPADVLGIAEGIETAAAAAVLHDVPVWAALTAGRLEKWEPPAGVRVIVFGDRDRSFTGEASAYALAKRLRAKRIDVEVRLPDVEGDWNDVLLGRGTRLAA